MQVWGKAANPLHIVQRFLVAVRKKEVSFPVSTLCVSEPLLLLTLTLSTWGVLYRRPLGFGPAAKPIRLECV